MIKPTLSFFLILTLFSTYAQSFLVTGGFSSSKIEFADFSDNVETASSGHFGFFYETPINDQFFVSTGLNFVGKGYNLRGVASLDGVVFEFNTNVDFTYLDIPLVIGVPIEIGSLKILPTAGLYTGVGVGGTFEFVNINVVDGGSISWGNEEGSDDFKRFDFGYQVSLGFEVKNVRVSTSYNHGLRNINVVDDDDLAVKNRNWLISLGYRFDRSKGDSD